MEGKAALFKRFAGIDAWPICLDTQDADEIVRTVQLIAPGLRRHQPRGHLRAALLRDRGAAARAARHPGLPRRPARHRDRGARGADQRAAVVGKDLGDVRIVHVRRGRGRLGDPRRCCSRPAPRHVVVADVDGVIHARPARTWHRTLRVDRREHEPRRRARRPARGAARAPTSSSASRRRTCSPATTSPRWPRRHRLRAGQPRPRGRPGRGRASTRPWSRPAAPTTRTRSTTCWPSPASSAACSTRTSHTITIDMLLAAARALAAVVSDDELNANYSSRASSTPTCQRGGGRGQAAVRAVRRRRSSATTWTERTSDDARPDASTARRWWRAPAFAAGGRRATCARPVLAPAGRPGRGRPVPGQGRARRCLRARWPGPGARRAGVPPLAGRPLLAVHAVAQRARPGTCCCAGRSGDLADVAGRSGRCRSPGCSGSARASWRDDRAPGRRTSERADRAAARRHARRSPTRTSPGRSCSCSTTTTTARSAS